MGETSDVEHLKAFHIAGSTNFMMELGSFHEHMTFIGVHR